MIKTIIIDSDSSDQRIDRFLKRIYDNISQSFIEKNEPGAMAFCLGKETAIEARKYFNEVQVANSPDFESLIELIEINLKKV